MLTLTVAHRDQRRARFRPPFHDLPIDVLPPILAQLDDRKDWHTCTLVSKTFRRAATPLLYNTLDSRVISKTFVHHPCTTLLARPELARYVRRVTETGAVHRGMHLRYPNITKDALSALSLCTNLHSMTWIDDVSSRTSTSEKLLGFIDVIRLLPVRELTIRTHTDLGEEVWAQLIKLTGLHKVSIWCMEGPPRVLQGWSGPLGSTLTHLELGRCAGVPPTILITVLAQLPLLEDLRLKGAPATAIPTILTFLPNLQTLDTEYLLSGSGAYYRPRPPRPQLNDVTNNNSDDDTEDPPLPTLRKLTVRTSSMDNLGPQKLWPWIRELVPLPGLETLRLHAFTYSIGSLSRYSYSSSSQYMYTTGIPRMFILDLAREQGGSLREFNVGEASLTLGDVECLCSLFGRLEVLICAVASPDVASIVEAISQAKNLQTLKLQVTWIPKPTPFFDDPEDEDEDEDEDGSLSTTTPNSVTQRQLERQRQRQRQPYRTGQDQIQRFTREDATRMMLRSEESKLRVISIGAVQYTGKWVLEERHSIDSESQSPTEPARFKFVVLADVAEDKWKT